MAKIPTASSCQQRKNLWQRFMGSPSATGPDRQTSLGLAAVILVLSLIPSSSYWYWLDLAELKVISAGPCI